MKNLLSFEEFSKTSSISINESVAKFVHFEDKYALVFLTLSPDNLDAEFPFITRGRDFSVIKFGSVLKTGNDLALLKSERDNLNKTTSSSERRNFGNYYAVLKIDSGMVDSVIQMREQKKRKAEEIA